MLDAAHGEAVAPVAVVQRVHVARVRPEVARVVIARNVGRRTPATAFRADDVQGSRRVEAVARSRYRTAVARMNGPEKSFGFRLRSGLECTAGGRRIVLARLLKRFNSSGSVSGLLNLRRLAGRSRGPCHSGRQLLVSPIGFRRGRFRRRPVRGRRATSRSGSTP